MAAREQATDHLAPDAEHLLAAMAEAREGTLELIDHLGERELEMVHSPIMSPLVWDLGHIAAYEDLWIGHRHGGLELLRGEIETLGPSEALEYLFEVRDRTAGVLAERG